MKRLPRLISVLAWFALSAGGALAATVTWTGGADNNWFNSANWSGSGNYPQNGDSVTISSGTVQLTNSTAQLADFTINTTNFTFVNWTTALRATNITVQASGGFRHALCDTNTTPGNTNRVYIICSNITILGTINVTQLGHRGATNAAVWAQGPGGSRDAAGGSYGGLGGGTNVQRGSVYGSLDQPSDPGSGGGGRAAAEQGGHGGGVVRIEASGQVLLNGTISAEGLARANNAGGGSGGSVHISCNTFAATNGTLRAKGGNTGSTSGHTGNGGGGGRISVTYNLAAQQSLNLTDRPFLNVYLGAGYGYNGTRSGEPGTLYLSDASFFPVTNSTLRGGQLLIEGFSEWTTGDLTINTGKAVFPPEFILTVTNDIVISGTGAGLQTSNGIVNVGRDLRAETITPSFFYRGVPSPPCQSDGT